jgi:CRP-like cAMP-binding protein
MAQRTDIAKYRLSVSLAATEKELRLCAFALMNQYMAMHRVIAEHLELQPVELLILIATTTGNAQRTARPEALPELLRGSEPLPAELVVPMSRRAIARMTGIPKETVRRHVEGMIKRGILLAMPRGVRARPGLAGRKALRDVHRLVELHATCTELLIRLEAIAPQATRPTRANAG